MVGIMFKILLIISVIVAISCMCVVVACLLTAAKENGLPDIDDVDLVELFSSKIQKV
jgi:preprotein translocase subunit SecG